MKKTILSFFIAFMTIVLFGQEIKFSVSPTFNNVNFYNYHVGGPYGRAKFGLNTNIDYLIVSNKILEFGIGLGYQNSHVQIITTSFDLASISASTVAVNLMSINFRTVCNLRKDFYLTLVPTLDLEIKYNPLKRINNQSGFGFSFGLGNNVNLSDALSLNIEPRLWIHNIIPFNGEKHPFRLTTVGINMGLVFGNVKDQSLQ